jgi:GNAT superfamily N-acetyltransferase
MPNQPEQRKATAEDVPVLVKHRRWMFEDLAAERSGRHEPGQLEAMETAYAEHLRDHLAKGTAEAWVTEVGGRIVASGVILILPWPPVPGATGERMALLHGMYTAPEHRRRGLARGIVHSAIAFCRQEGCLWIILGGRGSNAGGALYESVGFRPIEYMRLAL